jgi:hypothetical protein
VGCVVASSCGRGRPPEPPGGGAAPGACTCASPLPPHPLGVDPTFERVSGKNAPVKPTDPSGTVPVHVVDLDHDGWLDLTTHRRIRPPKPTTNGPAFPSAPMFRVLNIYDSSIIPSEYYFHGVVAADLDNDGDEDIVLAPYCDQGSKGPVTQPILFFVNKGDTFTPVTPANLPGVTCGDSETIAIADVDADGRVDLYIPFYSERRGTGFQVDAHPKRALLLMNRTPKGGALAFSEEAIARKLACEPSDSCEVYDGEGTPDYDPEGAQFVDINYDGNVDLVSHNRIYLNDGTGHFGDQYSFKDVGIDRTSDKDEGLTAIDYNMDGQIDLFQRVKNRGKLLWRRWLFTQTGGTVPFGTSPTSWNPNAPPFPFTNDTQGTEVQQVLDQKNADFAWGDVWGDLNGDGWPDLVLQTTGHAPLLFVNRGPKTPAPKSDQIQVWFSLAANCKHDDGRDECAGDLLAGGGFAVGDFDNDGRLDLYSGTSNTGEGLYLNTTPRLCGLKPLAISPRDYDGRPNQYGATVQLIDKCDPSYRPRLSVGAWGTYLALNQYDAQLGTVEGHCYDVTVRFPRGPDGTSPVQTVAYDPAAEGGRRIVIRRGGESDPRAPLGP